MRIGGAGVQTAEFELRLQDVSDSFQNFRIRSYVLERLAFIHQVRQAAGIGFLPELTAGVFSLLFEHGFRSHPHVFEKVCRHKPLKHYKTVLIKLAFFVPSHAQKSIPGRSVKKKRMNDWSNRVSISPDRDAMARAAADYAVSKLNAALKQNESVRLLAATGASQLEFLKYVVAAPNIDWNRIELFHLDEYIGVGIDHPASFAGYIRDRIIKPTGIPRYHLLDGAGDPEQEVRAASEAVSAAPIHVAFVGIGENAHLAFNDPPADFETQQPYLIVDLDEKCRLQQVGEGWFAGFNDVPARAMSMSVRQILKAQAIVCTVPDERKSEAVKASLTGPVTPQVPASILQTHPDVRFFLDENSARLLQKTVR
jgi:glucosamine-6-phosphate deaminase